MKYFKITDLRTGEESFASSTRGGETVRTMAVALDINTSKHHEIKEITFDEFNKETEKVFTVTEES